MCLVLCIWSTAIRIQIAVNINFFLNILILTFDFFHHQGGAIAQDLQAMWLSF